MDRRWRDAVCFIGFSLCLIFALALAGCGFARRGSFRVIQQTSGDQLQAPDRHVVPFSDVLRDYNNFEPGKGWIDLRAQMELRIENAYYEKGASRRGLQGFLGTGVARYQIVADGLRLASVQPMQDLPAGDTPVEQLIPATLQHARLYRLYYEIVFNRAKNTHGSVLLAGDSENELEALAGRLDQPEVFCDAKSSHCAAFPEACSVSVEMKLVVNGRDETLVWGSRLVSVVGEHPQQVEMKRLYAGRLRLVEIKQRDAGALRLPLLPGDHIRFR